MHCIQRWQLSSKEVPVFSPEYTSRWRLFTSLKPFLRFWRFTHFGSLCDVNVLLQKVIFTAMLKLSTAYQIKGSAALTNKFYTKKKNLPFFKIMRKFWKCIGFLSASCSVYESQLWIVLWSGSLKSLVTNLT